MWLVQPIVVINRGRAPKQCMQEALACAIGGTGLFVAAGTFMTPAKVRFHLKVKESDSPSDALLREWFDSVELGTEGIPSFGAMRNRVLRMRRHKGETLALYYERLRLYMRRYMEDIHSVSAL